MVFRHRPYEPRLNAVFDRLVNERHDLFDCYQSCHAPKTEAALGRADYAASFIRYTPGTALFVGLYEVAAQREITLAECLARPLHRELMELGMSGDFSARNRDTITEFALPLTDWHREWRGKLLIRWPGLERSWYRWADRNIFPIEAIALTNLLEGPLPRWQELVLSHAELSLLSPRLAGALGQWRGVYLITDEADGKQYVGSASGADNLLQRWRDYARSGHGGNKLLRKRTPATFRFSILQVTAHDLPTDDVIAIEQSWKLRLRTAAPHGLNEN